MTMHAGATPDPQRLRFLEERRRLGAHRFDTLHSAHYDEHWGAIGSTHGAWVERLLDLLPQSAAVLDAACGTGKYWPALLARGVDLLGVDQSAGMLAQAALKFPSVVTQVVALQDLGDRPELRGRFDGLLCVDALEYVGPEHWPPVLAGLAAVLRPGGVGYLTVELSDQEQQDAVDPRAVAGEWADAEGGYHYYPGPVAAIAWIEQAGLVVLDRTEADEYLHLLVRAGRVEQPPRPFPPAG